MRCMSAHQLADSEANSFPPSATPDLRRTLYATFFRKSRAATRQPKCPDASVSTTPGDPSSSTPTKTEDLALAIRPRPSFQLRTMAPLPASTIRSPHILHQGFSELLDLASDGPGRLGKTLRGRGGQQDLAGVPYGTIRKVVPAFPALPILSGDVVPGQMALRKRKVDKKQIGGPTDFRHIFHAATAEQFELLMLQWSIAGPSSTGGQVDPKLGDPAWAPQIREIIRARAVEQQARAVAAVVDATARAKAWKHSQRLAPAGNAGGKTLDSSSRPPIPEGLLAGSSDKGSPTAAELRRPVWQLQVMNGLPSSIYARTPTGGGDTWRGHVLRPPLSIDASVSPVSDRQNMGPNGTVTSMMTGDTPALIANLSNGFFDTSAGPGTLSPILDSFPAPIVENQARLAADLRAAAAAPLAERMISLSQSGRRPPSLSPASEAVKSGGSSLVAVQHDIEQPERPELVSTFPVIHPSIPTLEKAMSVALYFESFYSALLHPPPATRAARSTTVSKAQPLLSRDQRLAYLEHSFASPENRWMSEAEKEARREMFARAEHDRLREKRRKVDVQSFEMGRVIGHGAFGVVRIGREKAGERLVAVKQLRKVDMLTRSQEAHILAEKDALIAASALPSPTGQSWIVQLLYSFQDADHLYLVMEYMGGGDLLTLLEDVSVLPEQTLKFYMAEMVLALQATHALGYIHRDIKPDNFLFTPSGHIKVSDFGMATDLRWQHDTRHYEVARAALMSRWGVDLEGYGATARGRKKGDLERVAGREWEEQGQGVLTWREGERRKLAYSVCGTNSYMAPEVIRGEGYGFSCDWWSLGIIMYECLFGYLPFVAKNRMRVREKIVHWQKHLVLDPRTKRSDACEDLLLALLCDIPDRIGCDKAQASKMTISSFGTGRGWEFRNDDGAERIKAHKFFRGIDWSHIHQETPPFQPDLQWPDDTKHFDQNIPDTPLQGDIVREPKDPMLRDKKYGPEVLAIRKQLAFKGWTYKAPQPVRAPLSSAYPALPSFDPPTTNEMVDKRRGKQKDIEHLKDANTASDDTIKAQIGAVGTWVGPAPALDDENDYDWKGTVRIAESQEGTRGRASSL